MRELPSWGSAAFRVRIRGLGVAFYGTVLGYCTYWGGVTLASFSSPVRLGPSTLASRLSVSRARFARGGVGVVECLLLPGALLRVPLPLARP